MLARSSGGVENITGARFGLGTVRGPVVKVVERSFAMHRSAQVKVDGERNLRWSPSNAWQRVIRVFNPSAAWSLIC